MAIGAIAVAWKVGIRHPIKLADIAIKGVAKSPDHGTAFALEL
jgi:hypothetical protein